MRCPLCGAVAQEGEPFCALCGAALGSGPEGRALYVRKRGYLEMPGGERVEVTDRPLALGRSVLGPLAPPDRQGLISRAHFTVVREGDRFLIEDAPGPAQPKASANGTWVRLPGARDPSRVANSREITDGTSIDVAHLLTLRFVIEEGTA